jgi:hypothetical protein
VSTIDRSHLCSRRPMGEKLDEVWDAARLDEALLHTPLLVLGEVCKQCRDRILSFGAVGAPEELD